QIFTHLHPADLLSVSRINKTLRGMLLHRSGRWIWRASFANGPVYGCPEVPDDLNEPQFARFLFDELCMV
ncbi:hypothetical protein BD626DRAFT_381350, partial [Schizophyllum amplum]